MSVTRREMMAGAGVMAAVGLSCSASACSPAGTPSALPQNYFGKIASRKYEEAYSFVDPVVKMSVVTTKEQTLFAGPVNVSAYISNLMHTAGFRMIGDNVKYAPGGMYWQENGPWLCSDMTRGESVLLSGCGGDTFEGLINVFVGINYEDEKIKQILLLENTNFLADALPMEPL